ncbi:MAG: hypothetical protein E3J88_06040 [Anaerolineales bacterium]|nr:MAG: hypothetical protein E3J88_06040 [Anaerolineales bacterium]
MSKQRAAPCCASLLLIDWLKFRPRHQGVGAVWMLSPKLVVGLYKKGFVSIQFVGQAKEVEEVASFVCYPYPNLQSHL